MPNKQQAQPCEEQRAEQLNVPVEKVSLSIPNMVYLTIILLSSSAAAIGSHYSTRVSISDEIHNTERTLSDRISKVEKDPPTWVVDVLRRNSEDVDKLEAIAQANAQAIARLTVLTERLADDKH